MRGGNRRALRRAVDNFDLDPAYFNLDHEPVTSRDTIGYTSCPGWVDKSVMMFTPSSSRAVPDVCFRSWKLRFGSLAASRAGSHTPPTRVGVLRLGPFRRNEHEGLRICGGDTSISQDLRKHGYQPIRQLLHSCGATRILSVVASATGFFAWT